MKKTLLSLYVKGVMAKESVVNTFKSEKGEANIIAIILVIAIVVALAFLFRESIEKLFGQIWSQIDVEGAGSHNMAVTPTP